MTTGKVRASCPECGQIDVRGVDITIFACLETVETVYRFRCPGCASWIVNDAGPSVVMLLLRTGAPAQRWHQPLPHDDRADPTRSPLSVEDLVNFHDALARLPTANR